VDTTAEFLKIVDSHVPDPASLNVQKQETTTSSTLAVKGDVHGAVPLTDEMVLEQNMRMWGDEWKLLDTYDRGYITADQLQSFLTNCNASLPPQDVERFLELYVDSTYVIHNITVSCISY
jgi:hypothetical protein